MTLVFCMKKKLSYLTFLKVMYVKKGINFRHDIYSVEMNTANIYCRRCKYQLCITYNFFPHTLKIVWCNFKREQKVPYGWRYTGTDCWADLIIQSSYNYIISHDYTSAQFCNIKSQWLLHRCKCKLN